MGRSAGSADTLPAWAMAGGAPRPIACYQPKGAASLAASYVNLANPGTYDAAPGVAPTWAAATGWTFNGIGQYLTTGIVPASGWSMLIRFSDRTGADGVLIGSAKNTGSRFYLRLLSSSNAIIYATGGAATVAPILDTGVLAVAGQQGYRNGSADGGAISAWLDTSNQPLTIGAYNNAGALGPFFAGKIQAAAIYSATLTAAQVAAVSAAMAAL